MCLCAGFRARKSACEILPSLSRPPPCSLLYPGQKHTGSIPSPLKTPREVAFSSSASLSLSSSRSFSLPMHMYRHTSSTDLSCPCRASPPLLLSQHIALFSHLTCACTGSKFYQNMSFLCISSSPILLHTDYPPFLLSSLFSFLPSSAFISPLCSSRCWDTR